MMVLNFVFPFLARMIFWEILTGMDVKNCQEVIVKKKNYHPTSLAFYLLRVSHYCMYCLFKILKILLVVHSSKTKLLLSLLIFHGLYSTIDMMLEWSKLCSETTFSFEHLDVTSVYAQWQ